MLCLTIASFLLCFCFEFNYLLFLTDFVHEPEHMCPLFSPKRRKPSHKMFLKVKSLFLEKEENRDMAREGEI